LNDPKNSVLSVDIGGSKIVAGIIDMAGNIKAALSEPLKYPYSQNTVWETTINLCERILENNANTAIIHAGAAIPGLTDPEKGLWVFSGFSGIKDMPFSDMFYDEFGIKCFIENDVNACALGEMHFGACKNVDDFIWVTISNGIGGSIVMDGKLRVGANKSSGEIGHVCVKEFGPLCKCGKNGCLEACAAGPAILDRYLELVDHAGIDTDSLSAESIAAGARNGDAIAVMVYEEVGYYLGSAFASAINLLNPSKIILGGGVSASMDLFYPSMMKTMDEKVFKQANPNITIEQTALGYNAALFGAATVGFTGSNMYPNQEKSF